MKKILFPLLLFFFSAAYGQKDSIAIKGFIGFQGMWQTGNLEQLSLMPNGKLSLNHSKHYAEILGNYHLLKVNGFNVKNDLWAYGLYQYQPSKRVFASAHFTAGFANSFRIKQSTVIGLGAGVNILQNSATKYLQVHLYPAYMKFQWETQNPIQTVIAGFLTRANLPLGEKLLFRWELSSYHSLEDPEFWGGGNLFQLNYRISKSLIANVSHQSYSNNQPISGIENFNTQMLFGFQYKY